MKTLHNLPMQKFEVSTISILNVSGTHRLSFPLSNVCHDLPASCVAQLDLLLDNRLTVVSSRRTVSAALAHWDVVCGHDGDAMKLAASLGKTSYCFTACNLEIWNGF